MLQSTNSFDDNVFTMLKLVLVSLLPLVAVQGFLAPQPPRTVAKLKVMNKDLFFTKESKIDDELEWIAHHLKLQVYDPDTSVYGFDSKDRLYGIENVRVSLPIEPSLGLDLVELAHGEDSRGLVLVSGVHGNAKATGRIQVGDTIIGLFVGQDYKESTTALNFEETMSLLEEAKECAKEKGLDTIDLELNRLVKRETVKVFIEEDWRDGHGDVPIETEIDALAGDNLRLLLLHHHKQVYDERTVRLDTLGHGNCGGEAICGTCLVEIVDGMDTLNPKGPQEKESKHLIVRVVSLEHCSSSYLVLLSFVHCSHHRPPCKLANFLSHCPWGRKCPRNRGSHPFAPTVQLGRPVEAPWCT